MSTCILTFFVTILCVFVVLDTYLLFLIQESSGPLPLNFQRCTAVNPYCTIDVKSLLLDWLNFYVHCPLSVLVYKETHFSTVFHFISANQISVFHVLLAAIAARMIAHSSLCVRRLGVCVFELRNFLDALDGTVARGNKNNGGDSMGYYIDGICDGLGCGFLLIGIWVYLRNHPVKKKSLLHYSPLPTIILPWEQKDMSGNLPSSSSSLSNSASICLPKMIFSIRNKVCRSGHLPVWMGIQWFLSSSGWNRYIFRFSGILEKSATATDPIQILRQGEFLRKTLTIITLLFWRLINVHATVELVLLSIFCDRLTSWGEILLYLGWILLIVAVCLGELLLYEASLTFL